MPGDCTGYTPANAMFESSITSMAEYPCWPGCLKEDFVAIVPWGTKEYMKKSDPPSQVCEDHLANRRLRRIGILLKFRLE